MAKQRWDVRVGGTAYGPLTFKQIRAGVRQGALHRRSPVRPAGSGEDWRPAKDVGALQEALKRPNRGMHALLTYFPTWALLVPALLVAGLAYLHDRALEARAVTVEGEVVEVQRWSGGVENPGLTSYVPVVAFLSQEGERHRVETSVSSHDAEEYVVGQRVRIAYDPDDPDEAWLAGRGGWFYFARWALVMAVFGLALQVGVFLRRKKRRVRWLRENGEQGAGA